MGPRSGAHAFLHVIGLSVLGGKRTRPERAVKRLRRNVSALAFTFAWPIWSRIWRLIERSHGLGGIGNRIPDTPSKKTN
jgi:hypothetical protein